MFGISGKYKSERILIFLFVLDLLFDGILRKWLLLPLSAPLMMVKQVLAIAICVKGVNLLSHFCFWEKAFAFCGAIAFLNTILLGHGNLIVDIYGCLPYFFGLTLCTIIGKCITENDITKISQIIVYTGIVNSALVIIQFSLPPAHILNFKGFEVEANIADSDVAELSGMFRPVGIFIHSTHSNLFMILYFAIIIYYLFQNNNLFSRKTLLSAITLEFIACICSASRTCIFLHAGMLAYFLLFCMGRQGLVKSIRILSLGIPVSLIIAATPIGSKAINNLQNRFDKASEAQYGNVSTTEGTVNDLLYRGIGYNIAAIINPQTMDGKDTPLWGFGQGMSTQVGGRLLDSKSGKSGFSLAEWDGLRIMCESGLLLGWAIIFIRLGYVVRFIPRLKFYRFRRMQLTLLLFIPFFISFYLQNTWGNVFLANFAFLCGGLFLATKRLCL